MDEPTICSTCGAHLPPRSAFCGRCGRSQEPAVTAAAMPPMPAPVPLSPPPQLAETEVEAGPPSAASSPRQVPRGALVLVVLVVLALIAGVGGLVVKNQNTAGQLHDEQDRHAITTRRLGATAEDLAKTDEKLNVTKAKLTTTSDELATRTEERNTAKDELLWANTQLEGVRNSLGNANTQLDGQSQLIEDLRVCLGGVLNALSDSAYGNYTSALAELNAVEATCQAANDAL